MASDEQPDTRHDPFAALLEDSAEDLYENAPCGYLSTLPDGTIAKVNETFLRWTGYRREELVGRRRFQTMLPAGDRIFYETHYAPLLRMQQGVREIAIEIVCSDGRRLPALVNSVVKTDSDGHIAYIRTSVFDASQRREYERELLRARQRAEESEARARELARTLQASFIPPEPPSIPGLEIGAVYRAAGGGDEVGGDFYDVFATADHDWVVVLGDVRGKGVLAARVTALARHTVRTAAMQTPAPAAVLTTLNQALRSSDEDRFCTVAYARIQTLPDRPVRVTLAIAGHAPPLRVTSEGATSAVGELGDLIGVLERPEFSEVAFELQRGEVLCFFTDGVTEGRNNGEYYGDDRLAAALTAHAAGTASSAAEEIVNDVVSFQRGAPRDDIAVVVLKRS
ncbi:MAG: SpoIIE family protein phosphatase [Nitriliruptorales bacterium]|nr:SpoIIE family protein phosphatase [Nitriliruptorales bacterium]